MSADLLRRPLSVFIDLVAPWLMACLVFAAGTLILFSAATPGLVPTLSWLADTVPLFVVELSHFAASIIGLVLLFLAVGLANRMRTAWRLTLCLLILSAAFAIFRGSNLEEAMIFAAVALMGIGFGPSFYRQDRLSQIHFSAPFLITVVLILIAIAWLGFFAYREVAYSQELWWTFVLYGDASRFLRATVGVAALTALLLLRHFTSRSPAPPRIGNAQDVARAQKILNSCGCEDPQANLALLGDKRFLFAQDDTAFVQFAVRGHSWIAMGEPVGSRAGQLALLRAFHDAADHQGASSAFYAVSREHLPDFIDAGYVPLKIGETALIDLQDFSLDGPKRAPLRHARNKAARDGLSFEMLPPDSAFEFCEELRAISQSWLDRRQGAEKQFSLGRFEKSYLSNFSIAIVRREGKIVSFANLWTTTPKTRISIDLMRYQADAPNGTMDYMFCQLILWAKEQGYKVFDLGMAPLAGLEHRRQMPLASRIGALVYSHGGRIYGFEGLTAYKQKFHPRWEGVYLAVNHQAEASGVMANVALLTSGGWGGLLS